MTDKTADAGKRRFLTLATSIFGGIGAGFWAWPFLSSWQPSAKARAAGAPVTADISDLPPGEMKVVAWRGKPVWIVRRTPEMLNSLPAVENDLRDPKSDEDQQPEYARNATRSIKPEVMVMVGSCTHLGCSPLFRPGPAPDVPGDWKGGFFCPCHGSKFDLAGRVFENVPAPLNLEVPKYRFENENVVVIGEDPAEKGVA